MPECLLCDGFFSTHLTLQELFSFQKHQQEAACPACRKKFCRLCGHSVCPGCSRPQAAKSFCLDCQKWQRYYPMSLVKHQALFQYNETMREWLHTYKFKGDIRLARIFVSDIQQLYRRNKSSLFVPLPVSLANKAERGFNQCEELLRTAAVPFQLLLENGQDTGKQSEKNRQQRLLTRQPFQLNTKQLPQNTEKQILLFDDVYTTGRTLYHAKEILAAAGFKNIISVTLAR